MKKGNGKEVAKIKTFKVGGFHYEVRPLPDLVRMYSVWGRCDHIGKFIDFDESASATEMLGTIVHETLEALKSQRDLETLDHHTIINIEDGVLAMLVDNPDFFLRCLEFIKKEQ